MARSYFSRIATPARVTALVPPRPITTLWKAARLERLSGKNGVAHHSGLDLTDSADGRIARPRTLVERRVEQDDPSGEVRQLEPELPIKRPADAEENGLTRSWSQITIKSRVRERESQRDRSRETTREVAEAAPVRPSTGRERGLISDAKAVDEGFREFTRPAAVPVPLHMRSTSSAEYVGSHAARGETKNSLHIGKIEVQVVPPRSSGRQPPPSKPTGRLARGYALRTNWQQQ